MNSHRCSSVFIGGVTLLLVSVPQCVVGASITEVHYTMGTYFTITVEGLKESDARTAMRQCFVEARRLEAVFSRYDHDSELSKLNADPVAPRAWLSADMADLLGRATMLRDATDGAFDVSIGRLTQLWRDSSEWPPSDAVQSIATGGQDPAVAVHGRELVRLRPGVQLDFDGIAKGYAVDRCVALLRAAAVPAALINLGESSQYALGAPPGRRRWEVTVRGTAADAAVGTVRLRNQALSASAVFGHSRALGGRRVGHIINPVSGQPLRTDALALVVSDSATDAEAYSKAVLIWGVDGAGRLQSRLRQSPIAGALYVEDGHVTTWHPETIGFRAHPVARRVAAVEEQLQ